MATTGQISATVSSGTPTEQANQDGVAFDAWAQDQYNQRIEDAKRTYAWNQSAEKLNQGIKIGNKLASIATGAITG